MFWCMSEFQGYLPSEDEHLSAASGLLFLEVESSFVQLLVFLLDVPRVLRLLSLQLHFDVCKVKSNIDMLYYKVHSFLCASHQ